MDDLLLEGAVEPLGDPVGLGLLDEGVGRLDAPVGDQLGEVLGEVLGLLVERYLQYTRLR